MTLFFPRSIEQNLREAGLSPVEVLVLHHLVQGKSPTIRQLAAATGKSTGVLDQVLRKLLNRDIITRRTINDAPCYILNSLESVKQWMHEDLQLKKDVLAQRHHDATSFLTSMERNRVRPDLAHFEGVEGICSAYRKLLTLGSKEIFCFLPMTEREDEHPYKEFLVHYTQERFERSILLHVITHDTPFGRQYASRDQQEYRHTTLVPADRLPIPFEHIIAGDYIVCFDFHEERASFLRYPQLAQAERAIFLSMISKDRDESVEDKGKRE